MKQLKLKMLFFTWVGVSLVSCQKSANTGNNTPVKQPVIQISPQPTQNSSNYVPGTSVATAGAVDIVVVNAIGGENPELRQRSKANLESLLTSLSAKLNSNPNFKLALIASPAAAVSGVPLSLSSFGSISQDRVKQVNFELATKDVLLGTIVTGCESQQSNLSSEHSPGQITVCGKKFPVPAHSWTWSNQDLQGKLVGFLRPGAKRFYVLVASSDSSILTASDFSDLGRQQNSGGLTKVFAIAPTSPGGGCNSQNIIAQNLIALSQLTSGRSFSYCDQNWGTHIQSIANEIN